MITAGVVTALLFGWDFTSIFPSFEKNRISQAKFSLEHLSGADTAPYVSRDFALSMVCTLAAPAALTSHQVF